MLHVYRNYHPDHSCYRFARWLQWHRWRSVLWRRPLRWRRPRPHHRDPVDPAPARKDLTREFVLEGWAKARLRSPPLLLIRRIGALASLAHPACLMIVVIDSGFALRAPGND